MKKKLVLCAVGLICLCYQIQLCKSSACHDFQFYVPLLENSSFSVPENTPLNVTLYVVGKGTCTSFSMGMIMVWQQDELTGNNSETLCLVGADKLTSKDCTCKINNSVTPLECTITIDNIKRGKELVMKSTPNTTVKEKTVPINVTYPSTISDFQITPSHVVRENESVAANCSWVNGNPQPRILIRNPKNKTVVSQNPANQLLVATIFEGNMTCSDSGQYRCEAEGTDHYKAVDLMVKCPPRIMNVTEEKTVVLGSSAAFQFDVFSYKNLTVCTLEEPRINGTINCSSDKTEIKIRGAPPHLRLEIKVKNTREDDEGTWQLTVGNDFADHDGVQVHDTANFTLQHTDKPAVEANDIWTVVIVCVTFSVASAVLCVGIAVTLRRTRRRKRGYITGAKKKCKCVGKFTPQLEEPLIDNVNEDIMTHMSANIAKQKAGTTLDKHNLDAKKDARNEGNLENGVGPLVTPREEHGNCIGKVRPTTGEPHTKTVDPPEVLSDAPESNANAQGTNPDSPQSNADASKSDDNASAAQAKGPSTNYDQGEIIIDARVPNAEGCLYGQLDFSGVKPRTSVIKDLPSTDYAQIDFNAPPPPLLEDSD